MRRAPPFIALLLLSPLALGCSRRKTEPERADAGAKAEPSGPIRLDNILGLELSLPVPWKRVSDQPGDLEASILLRARRPVPGAGLGVEPSLVVERPTSDSIEEVVTGALRSLEAQGNTPGVELEKTSTGSRTLGGRAFKVLEATFRVGPPGKETVRLVERSFFLEAPEGPAGARFLGFHFTHLAEHSEALGTELEVVLSGIQLTGPKLAVPGQAGTSATESP